MFERRKCDEGENVNADIMEVDLHRIYLDGCAPHQVPYIKSYLRHLMNNNRTQEIIYFDDQKLGSRRTGCESLYIEKHDN